ncbi:MAG: heavy-metal-associated domain-containing protein [Chloroflexi bacterium]|nr:heavy-metal-associated domain-containing protein [Chloroflexota bacterium]
MAKIVLDVPDVSCEHCERTITRALQSLEGVTSVRVDIPTKKVYLDYDPGRIALERISAVLDEEGYPVAASHSA